MDVDDADRAERRRRARASLRVRLLEAAGEPVPDDALAGLAEAFAFDTHDNDAALREFAREGVTPDEARANLAR